VSCIYGFADQQARSWTVYFHYEYFDQENRFISEKGASVGYYVVRAESGRDLDGLSEQIDLAFATGSDRTLTTRFRTYIASFRSQFDQVVTVVVSIGIAAFLIVALISATLLQRFASDVASDAAIAVALGFDPRLFGWIVFWLSVVIVFVGAVLGGAGTELVMRYGAADFSDFMRGQFMSTREYLVFLLVGVALVGVMSARAIVSVSTEDWEERLRTR